MGKRKRLLIGGLGSLTLVLLALAGLLWALFQPPEFYADADKELPRPEIRRQQAKQLVQETRDLVDRIEHAESTENWDVEFTQDQINSWFVEELPTNFPEWLPRGVSNPRLRLDNEQILLGFQADQTRFDGVISLHVRPRIIAANVVAIEVTSLRAGLVPLSVEQLLPYFETWKDKEGWRLDLTEQDGKPVFLVHLGTGQPNEPKLQSFQIDEHRIRLTGTTGNDSVPIEFDAPRTTHQLPLERQ